MYFRELDHQAGKTLVHILEKPLLWVGKETICRQVQEEEEITFHMKDALARRKAVHQTAWGNVPGEGIDAPC